MSNLYLRKDELYHHGTKGQKWGTRNYQNEDGSYTAKGQAENNGHGRYSTASNKEKNVLGIFSDADYDKAKNIAKILGVSLATAGGAYLVAYTIEHGGVGMVYNSATQSLSLGYNNTFSRKPYSIDEIVGANGENGSFRERWAVIQNKDYVGSRARMHGFSEITSEHSILDSNSSEDFRYGLIHNPLDALLETRRHQIGADANRRLSCWSTSMSYFLDNTTGNRFCSKSFNNLVDFKDFGALYKNPPKIYSANGLSTNSFIGKFGTLIKPFRTAQQSEDLFSNILNTYKNTESNFFDSSVDKITGFINAGYHGATCTHEWNFEIIKSGNVRTLFMTDGYSGKRVEVMNETLKESGEIVRNMINDYTDELHHYNIGSLRYYAPELKDLNLEKVSKVVLQQIE